MYIISPLLTVENIYKETDSYNIFRFYSKGFVEVGQMFKSDFRDDKNASCCVKYYHGDLLYTDFGDVPNEVSQRGSYRAIQFVMRLFRISFVEALNKINIDMGLGLAGQNVIKKYKPLKNNIEPTDDMITVLSVKKIPFSSKDLDYWNSFYWAEEMLKRANIHAISHFWINNYKFNNRLFDVSNRLAYSFDYYWSKDVFRRKLYFPESKDYRFVSNIDDTIVQGWDLLPKEGGDILFITKGFKDIGIFWRLGYNAVAPNNEKTFIPEKVYRKLKERWKTIIIWFDNDETGIKGAKYFSKKYNIPYFNIPINCEDKDPSDFAKYNGLREFNYLLKENLLKNGIKVFSMLY